MARVLVGSLVGAAMAVAGSVPVAADDAAASLVVRDPSGCVSAERVAAQVAAHLGESPWRPDGADVIEVDVAAPDAAGQRSAVLRRGAAERVFAATTCAVLEANLAAALAVALAPAWQPPVVPAPVATQPQVLVTPPAVAPARSLGPWITMGSGALLITLGYALDGVASARMDAVNTRVAALCTPSCAAAPRADLSTALADADDARRLGTAGTVSWGIGLAAIAAGVTWAMVDRHRVHAVAMPTSGGGSVALAGTF